MKISELEKQILEIGNKAVKEAQKQEIKIYLKKL